MEAIFGVLEDVGQLIRVIRSLQVSVFGSLTALNSCVSSWEVLRR